MTTRNRVDPSFDESAALEELERLQRAIEASRKRRGETVDEFNAFVRSFKRTEQAAAGEPVSPPRARPAAGQVDPPPAVTAPAASAPAIPAPPVTAPAAAVPAIAAPSVTA